MVDKMAVYLVDLMAAEKAVTTVDSLAEKMVVYLAALMAVD